MRVSYTSSTGPGHTYEIESDRHGNYTVTLQGKVIKRVSALSKYMGKPRWGSKQLEVDAIQDAKIAIESLKIDER